MSSTRPRVTFVSGSLPEMPCGVGDYTARLASSLREQGADVGVVTSVDSRLLDLPGVRISRATGSWGLLNLPRVLRALRRERPEIVHLQYPTAGYRHGLGPAALLPALRILTPRTRIVLTLHEFVRSAALHRLFIAALTPWAHAIVTPDRTQLVGLPRITRAPITEIPLASTVGSAFSLPSDSTDETVVGTWGFQRADKGLDQLIRAFPMVAAARKARLVIAGDPGPEEEYATYLRDLAARSPVADRIEFTGRLTEAELGEVLGTFSVFALPYRNGLEINRTTYATARASGRPIVTTTLGQPRADRAANTYFISPDDPGVLAEAIMEAADWPVLPVANAAEEWTAIAKRHLDVYRSVMEDGERDLPGRG